MTTTTVGTFSSRGVASRPPRNWASDVAVFVGAAVLLWLVVRVGRGTAVPWTVPSAPSTVSTDGHHYLRVPGIVDAGALGSHRRWAALSRWISHPQ